LQIKIQIQVKI